ncbi:hypothetical protein O0L34_g633 [Tuta absoluta]|nr:hypothetical protein O0L34_g633 [Tuta absoluta]
MIDPIDEITEVKISALDYRALIGFPVQFIGAGGTYSFSELFRGEKVFYAEREKKDQRKPLHIGNAVVVRCDPKAPPFGSKLSGICVHSKCTRANQGLIPGDGGGPLLYKNKIIGITALYGPATMPLTHYEDIWNERFKQDMGVTGSIYTAVSPYLEWIHSVIISEESKCKKRTRPNKRERQDTPKDIHF